VGVPAIGAFGSGAAAPAAGPTPSPPVLLGGGAAVTFTWTFTAVAGGTISLSATAAGTDANDGAALAAWSDAGPVAILDPGFLVASLSVPAAASVGQTVRVVLTATNTGGSAVSGTLPAVAVAPGAGLVSLAAGPTPAGPVAIAPGAAQSFTWDYDVTGAGAVGFSATAAGSDACGPRAGAAAAWLMVETPAALAASLAVVPPAVNAGQSLLVVLTITNTGQAAALGVGPAAVRTDGAGTATLAAGPFPGAPVAVAGGASVTFTWTFTASAPGMVTFSTTASGADVNAGWAVSSGVASAAATISTAAVLAGAVSYGPATVSVSQTVTAVLTVTNTGGNAAIGAVPGLVNASTASLSLVSSPGGGPFTIPAGGSVSFTWVWVATGPGSVSLSLSVSGLDAVSGAPAFAWGSAAGLVQAPAALAASLALSATGVFNGETGWVTLTVSNTGEATAAGVAPPATPLAGGTAVTITAAPPPGAVSIPGGTSVSWTWSWASVSPGVVTFGATVTGTDANAGVPIRASDGPWTVRVEGRGLTIGLVSVSPAEAGLDAAVVLRATVVNVGTVPEAGVRPRPPAVSGDGRVALVSGPAPSATDLAPGASVTFVWTYRTLRGGSAVFTVVAEGPAGLVSPPAPAVLSIREAGASLADAVVYPNPFRPSGARGGTVKFRRLPPFSQVVVHTVAGERVAEVVADAHGLAEWDGRNRAGTRVSPGVYFCLLRDPATGATRTVKIQLSP
jgi:hypothetical protein